LESREQRFTDWQKKEEEGERKGGERSRKREGRRKKNSTKSRP
jgi:hypothetical protein